MLAGAAHDLAADGHAAGEEDVVKCLMEQRLVFRAAALDDADVLRREAVRDQFADDGGGRGRIGGGLDDAAVARGERADERLHRQHEGIIPGRHDQHDAIGVADGVAAGVELGQRRQRVALAREGAQMAAHEAQLGERHADLAHVALRGGLAEIGPEGIVDFAFALHDGALEPVKRLAAEFEGERPVLREIRTLASDEGFDLHVRPPSAQGRAVQAPAGQAAAARDTAGWTPARRGGPCGGCPRGRSGGTSQAGQSRGSCPQSSG